MWWEQPRSRQNTRQGQLKGCGFTLDMSLRPRSMRGGGFLSRMPASYGDTMAGLMKRRNMALPTAPMLFWGKRWLTTWARTVTHNRADLAKGGGSLKPCLASQAQASFAHRSCSLEWDSPAWQRSRTSRTGVGLPDSSCLSLSCCTAPLAGTRLPEFLPCVRADPRRALPLQGPAGLGCALPSPAQNTFHLLGLGSVLVTAQQSHQPLQQWHCCTAAILNLSGGALCRNTLQKHHLSTAGQKEPELSGPCTPLPTHTLQNHWADVKYRPLPSRKKEFRRCCKKKDISFPLGNQLCITTRRDALWISFI